jgi:hypothetical protein
MEVVQTKKPKNTKAELSTREIEKQIGTFNLENELNKIKIPMPLVELARNLIYKKQIAKAINFFDAECQADVINLQVEKPIIMVGPHIENNKDSIINQTPQVTDAEDEVGIGTESTSFSINRLSCSPKELGADQLTRFWRRNGTTIVLTRHSQPKKQTIRLGHTPNSSPAYRMTCLLKS